MKDYNKPLINSSVVNAPNFKTSFKLFVDASDVGVGAVRISTK